MQQQIYTCKLCISLSYKHDFSLVVGHIDSKVHNNLNAWETISQILWQTTCWYQICRFWHYRKIFYQNIHNQGKWNNPSFNQISFVPGGFNSIYAEYTAGIFMQHPKLSNSPLQLWIWCHYLQDDRQSCDLPNPPMRCEDDTLMWRSFPPSSQYQMGHKTL